MYKNYIIELARACRDILSSAHPKIIKYLGWHQLVSNLEMSNFFDEQGRTRVSAEAYMMYVAGENPRRTPLIGKRAISRWKLTNKREKN